MRKMFIILVLAVLPISLTQECFAQYWDSVLLPTWQGGANGPVEVVDLDGDEDQEVILVYSTMEIAENRLPDDWLLHSYEFESLAVAYDGHMIDLDGDLDLDFIYYGTGGGAHLGWIENLGDWEFEAHVIAEFETGGPGPTLSAGDIEGDGDIDIVFTKDTQGNSGLSAWYSDGEGGYDAYTLANHSHYYVSDLSDLNGDSLLDFVVADYEGLSLYLSLEPPEFEHILIADFPYVFGRPEIGDLDGDGDLDIACYRDPDEDEMEWDGALTWWENDGAANFTAHEIWNSWTPFFDCNPKMFDADNDGDTDIAIRSKLFINSGDNLTFEETVYAEPGAFYQLEAADLDNDGDMDLLNQEVRWFENPLIMLPELEPFHLLSPENEAQLDSNTVQLTWSSTTDDSGSGITYEVYLSQDQPDDFDLLGETDDTTFVFNGEPGTEYFWRVKALSTLGTNRWAEEQDWSFSITVPELAPFHLLAPANGAQSDSTDILFSWQSTSDYLGSEIGYEVYIAAEQPNDYELVGETNDTTFVFNGEPGIEYFWRIKAVSSLGAERWAEELDWSFSILENAVPSGALQDEIPKRFAIESIYPNPFNSSTTVTVALPQPSALTVTVYDLTGRLVRVLIAGQTFSAGNHVFTFNASTLAAGIYFIRAQVSNGMVQIQKVLLVK